MDFYVKNYAGVSLIMLLLLIVTINIIKSDFSNDHHFFLIMSITSATAIIQTIYGIHCLKRIKSLDDKEVLIFYASIAVNFLAVGLTAFFTLLGPVFLILVYVIQIITLNVESLPIWNNPIVEFVFYFLLVAIELVIIIKLITREDPDFLNVGLFKRK